MIVDAFNRIQTVVNIEGRWVYAFYDSSMTLLGALEDPRFPGEPFYADSPFCATHTPGGQYAAIETLFFDGAQVFEWVQVDMSTGALTGISVSSNSRPTLIPDYGVAYRSVDSIVVEQFDGTIAGIAALPGEVGEFISYLAYDPTTDRVWAGYDADGDASVLAFDRQANIVSATEVAGAEAPFMQVAYTPDSVASTSPVFIQYVHTTETTLSGSAFLPPLVMPPWGGEGGEEPLL